MPKIVDHDEYRKEILEKCLNLFGRKGYSNVTIREIAEEVGVSTGTLYHYFPTKQKILEQMFSYVRETNVGQYLEQVASINSVEERLDKIADFWIEHEELYQNIMLLAIDLLRNDKSDNSETVFNEFSEYYTHVMSTKLNLSTEFAKSLFIYILGLIFHSLLTPKSFSYSRQVSILKNMLSAFISEGNNSDLSKEEMKEALFNIFSTGIVPEEDEKSRNN